MWPAGPRAVGGGQALGVGGAARGGGTVVRGGRGGELKIQRLPPATFRGRFMRRVIS